MSGSRTITTAFNRFEGELNRLLSLDQRNQNRFRPGRGRPSQDAITRAQLWLLSEGILLQAVRAYEAFIEKAFLLYADGGSSRSGKAYRCHISPSGPDHVMQLLKGDRGGPIKWNTPDIIIRRAENYFHRGGPIKRTYVAHASLLTELRHVRNRIAHDNEEAEARFEKIVRTRLGTSPVTPLSPGAFLLATDRANPPNYFLITYLEGLRTVADNISA